ncbi:MAG: RagB/SusD family nutrient uptake outer membrane protein [Prevotella sp.]|nr:RagB/SusD family nutrient uptake outer membrane protein [Prevotella sp.]
MKKISIFISALCITCMLGGCSDFFDQESDHVIYSDNHKLDNATDSVYSMIGILNKLQAIADRTILLGEVRGDLVDLTNDASKDLREVAQFNIGNDNMYNNPRDYYAVINNCNFFIANADTALKDNRNRYIFMKEYAQAKAIRAWTYLQMVINYGKVRFVVDPILTKEQSEANYPAYGIQQVCEYFINDLLPLAEKYGREYPYYDNGATYRFVWFPINIVLGDLYLWAGSASGNVEYYRQAALRYYKYISERNGDNSTYATNTQRVEWMSGNSSWNSITDTWSNAIVSESYGENSELITMIPCNANKTDGDYSELRDLFNSREDNDYKVSITPSVGLEELSASQMFCQVTGTGNTVQYAPQGLSNHRTGDLRLYSVWDEYDSYNYITNERIEMQYVNKHQQENVHIYRRQMVYLRMAEALNLAGYPRMAFQVLSRGLNNTVIQEEVYPYYSQSDSIWISQFDFPTARYIEMDAESSTGRGGRTNANTMGMHTRGSGFTPLNEYYQLPVDTTRTEAEQTPDLQNYVGELILQEGALEFAFEGTRYYDILRFALRSTDTSFLANHLSMRKGDANKDLMNDIKAKLQDKSNWYLNKEGEIGPNIP